MRKLFLLGLLLCGCLFGCAQDNRNEAEIQEKIIKLEAKMVEGEPIFMEYLPIDEGLIQSMHI